MFDAGHCKVHPQATGAKGGNQGSGIFPGLTFLLWTQGITANVQDGKEKSC
jgi:hypothetical protein